VQKSGQAKKFILSLSGTQYALSVSLKKKEEKKTGWAGCRSRKVIHGKPSQGKLGRGTARENYGRGANQQENFEISAISSEVCLGRPALCQEGKSLELSGQRNLFALLELPALSKKPQKLQ